MAVNRVLEFTQNARTQLLALQQQVDEIFSGQIRDRSTLIQVKEQLESFTEQIQARLNQRTATGTLGRELNQMVAQGRQLFRTVEAYTRKVAGELQGERNRTGTDTVALRQAVAARATGVVHETGDAAARRAVATQVDAPVHVPGPDAANPSADQIDSILETLGFQVGADGEWVSPRSPFPINPQQILASSGRPG
ncbi:MAG: hypothetical protein AAFY60_13415, partial [Myxococcota bacterium]